MIKEINFSKKAVERINQLISKKPSGTFFRIAVKGGGCSGLSYDLQFGNEEENDTVIDKDGYKVYIDTKSMIYLKGMALDFDASLQGKGFVFVNPNATSTCGCGESFSMN